ncbi:uncharacterized protein E0L32_003901 [Thyridium curvatum]|uniref:Thioredoxin domain-containing protein n=1 Tax=Thyridium curvatum TaxID=1093900 RepID=A0A507B1U6_9PEZI|nr:uncharacterized protein E0L32_003901 [Thyridium curvatum]TPX16252.1 hypothetical protein E0L32_003901 [Thyridium curvatum]
METIYYIILALIAVFVIGPALFADRSPIPETSEKVHKITDAAELDALLASTSRVVVDFYADWCPPCRAIAPVFSQLAEAHAAKGRLAFAKVNVDHVGGAAQRYGVSAMPTFMFFRDGRPAGVAAEGLKGRQSVGVDAEGRVDKVRGADRAALEAVVRAMAGEK